MGNRHSSFKNYTSKPQLWQVTPRNIWFFENRQQGTMTLKEVVTHYWKFFSEEVTIELQSHEVGEEHSNRRNSMWKLTFFFPFLPSFFDSCTGLVSLASVWIRWFALSWWDKHDKPKNNGFLFLKAAWLQKKISSSGLTTFSLFS